MKIDFTSEISELKQSAEHLHGEAERELAEAKRQVSRAKACEKMSKKQAKKAAILEATFK
jgi:hypothetical protein